MKFNMSATLKAITESKLNLVWRIENKDGRGCYQFSNGWTMHDHSKNLHKTPVPHKDGIDYDLLSYVSNAHCGFNSINQPYGWFLPDELKKLSDQGFICSVYEVPEDKVYKGMRQVVFSRDSLKPKYNFNLDRLVNYGLSNNKFEHLKAEDV